MSHVEDRFQEMHPVPEGSSAQVETTEEVRITTPEKICGMGTDLLNAVYDRHFTVHRFLYHIAQTSKLAFLAGFQFSFYQITGDLNISGYTQF